MPDTIKYNPTRDNLYKMRMVMRLQANQTFRNVFKYDLTEHFLADLRSIPKEKKGFRENTIINLSGMSGCQPAGSKVLMADGDWKNIEDIKEGDEVISPQKDGSYSFSKILKTYRWFSDENYDIVMIHRKKTKLYSCSSNHILPFSYQQFPTILKMRKYSDSKYVFREYRADEISNYKKSYLVNRLTGLSSFSISHFKNRADCEIEPYSLGMYLSDGNFKANDPNITKGDKIVFEEINKFYHTKRIDSPLNKNCETHHYGKKSIFAKLLTKYGLFGKTAGNKFIPKSALLSSEKYRLRLLAGLIDGDGSTNEGTTYTTKSQILAEDIKNLVFSLGGRAYIHPVKGKIKKRGFEGDYFTVRLYISKKVPILIPHKKIPEKLFYINSNRVPIISVKNNLKNEVYGFTLLSDSGWYITDNWMLTHNSGKSLIALSIGKLAFPQFSENNVFFFDQEILDNAQKFPPNTILIRDENPQRAVFGMGSTRTSQQLGVMAETCRKYGLSIMYIEPSFVQDSISKILIETVDMDVENRITRCALRDTYTLGYMGAIYIPVLKETDPDWLAYNKRKDQFIDDIRHGKMGNAKMDYNGCVQKIVDRLEKSSIKYKNKVERKALIRSLFPTYTNGEVTFISTLLEIAIREGEEQGDDVGEQEIRKID